MNKDYSIIIPSNRDHLKDELIDYLKNIGEDNPYNIHIYENCIIKSS